MSNEEKNNNPKHYIFGYGSLICPHSRSITAPSLPKDAAHPVVIKHLQRTWTARTGAGWTAVGIHVCQDAECTGVLIEVDSHELAKFDIREGGYNREMINVEHVYPILNNSPSLQNQNYQDILQIAQRRRSSNNPSSDEKDNDTHVNNNNDNGITKEEKEVNIWVYIQNNPKPPTSLHPIPQSYVDIILRGCLSISHDFAMHFLKHTYGWYSVNNNDTKKKEEGDYIWINDRHVPIYVRADPMYSKEMGKEIDELIQSYHLDAFVRRKNV